jgi:beta-glucosidase
MQHRSLGSCICALVLIMVTYAIAANAPIYTDPKQPLEARVEDLLSRLTLEEKVSLMAGGSAFGTHAIERLGIPALAVSDGPNGLRSNASEPTTAFPTGSAMAATWNPALIQEVGEAIGEEAHAKGVAVMLGPNVNIQRTPLAGRNFESYSEDPLLAGAIGAGWVRGVQSRGIGATPKHFTANNQEFERGRSSSDMSERTLREIYLPAFEHIVTTAHPWAIMTAYNRVNGTYSSENTHLIDDMLKGEWGFDGVAMSDWDGMHTTVAAARAGLDLEMPGPGQHRGQRLLNAVNNWQVPETAIDESARRMLRLILRSGIMDGKPMPKGSVNTDAHKDVARRVAEEAAVLLKNDGDVLPLDPGKVHTVAVIGPNADILTYGGGGSALVVPDHVVTPLDAIKSLLGDKATVTYIPAVANGAVAPTADARFFSPSRDRREQGLKATYYRGAEFTGAPVKSETDATFYKMGFGNDVAEQTGGAFSTRWDGYFWPPEDGVYEFSLVTMGEANLTVDGKPVVGKDTKAEPSPLLSFFPVELRRGHVELKAGQAYPIRLDYAPNATGFRVLAFGMRRPTGTITDAVAAAKSADATIVFIGSSPATETEGIDRDSMGLYGDQNALVDAVLAARPNAVIVLNVGAPVTMPWIDKARAVLLGWLPGEEGGTALANVLFGKVNPSGKLPETFPARYEDNPTYLTYPGTRSATYGEGVFVGYRYYDSKKVAPLFPFGHGLSYTRFAYNDLTVSPSTDANAPVGVSVSVSNVGKSAGQDAVQLYIRDIEASVPRPFQELKAFQKVRLDKGARTIVRFALDPRAFSFYDEYRHTWVCEPGEFVARIGESSRDIRVEKRFTLDGDCKLAEGD